MRPRISYDTSDKMEKLVDDLRESNSEMGTDEQIQFLLQLVAESQYGIGKREPLPPWKREEWEQKQKRKRELARKRESRLQRSR